MKRAAKACWRRSRPGRIVLSLIAGLAMACAVFVSAVAAETGAGALHIARAEVMTWPGGSFDAAPPELAPDTPAGEWRKVALPFTWPRPVLPGDATARQATQVTWVRVPVDARVAGQKGLYLYLPRWQTIGRIAVYADERLVYRSVGDVVWNGFNYPLWISLDADGTAAPPKLLRVRIDSLVSAGGGLSSLWIGSAPALEPAFRLRRLLQARVSELMSVAVLGLGLFAFAVWLMRRRETVYLLFALFSLCLVLRGLHYHMGLEPLPIPSAWFGWITVNSVSAMLVTWYFFVGTLVPQAPRWPGRLLLGFLLACWLGTMPLFSTAPLSGGLASLSYLLTITAGAPAILLMAWAAWRHGSREGILASSVGVIDLPVAIHDWLMQNYMLSPEGIYFWPISTGARLVVFIYIILRRYVGAVEGAERANAHLAERLQARESELALSYEQLAVAQQRTTLTQERQRLMQDIHDGMGSQLMSALKVAEAGELSDGQMTLVLRECIDDLKLTVDSLEPVEADLLLLLGTLRYRLMPRLEGSGLNLRWEVRELPPLDWLDPRSALHVLRILQEGISNILQHAQASELHVRTGEADGGVFVVLADNGRGFGDREGGEAGKGLSNMTRRAQAIGGRVSWEALDAGTRFTLWLPLRHAA